MSTPANIRTLEPMPPSSVEAEQSVLGALLVDPDAIVVVGDDLSAADFHRDAHRLVYEAILSLRSRGMPSDVVTLTNELERRNQLAAVGGLGYLHSLAAVVPTAVHIQHYAGIVRETAQKRRLIQTGGRIAGLGYAGDTTSADALAEASRLIQTLVDERTERGGHISTVRLPEELKAVPIRTPFPSLDRCLRGGLRAGVSYVAAAPPAGLKTSLLVQVETRALLDGHGVVHITNELPAWVMRERYLANLAGYDFGVALEDIGRLHPVDYDARETAQQQLDLMPLFLYESIPTADEIGLRLAKVRAQRRDVGQWLLVLDYIQRLRGDSRQERRHVISDSFDRLQEIARNEGVALVIASSLPMSDWDTSPDTWGGRESGDIRGYTSVFLGLQRHKDADQREPDYLHLTAWLCKNTLGPETQIPMRVRASNQRWEQAAA